AARLATTLMPVALVKAALMSSTAFFIDAAANTVMVLSCAWAGVCAGSATSSAKRAIRAVRLNMAVLLGRQGAEPGDRKVDRPVGIAVPAVCGARAGRRGSLRGL